MCCSDDIKDRYILHSSCKDKKQYKYTKRGVRKYRSIINQWGSSPETAAQTEDPIYNNFTSTDTVWD